MTVKSYIQNKKVKHFVIDNIEVFEKDPIYNNILAKSIIQKVVETIPKHLLVNVDSIYIGQFDFLKDREVQAAYENSSIFITNEQDTEEDMLDDIYHEVAHSVEEKYARHIYADGKIEREFLNKRKNAFTLLADQGIEVELQDFLDVSFSENFDNFLYYEVGYPTLAMITSNIFYSPYAITSLREYFANGFEAFFVKSDVSRLKAISPSVFEKIVELVTQEEDK